MIDILHSRLQNHLLGEIMYSDPAEIIRHMLCLQSQDLTQAKWAISSRSGCKEQEIVDSFNRGKIVRTWTQRGTIHTVAAQDAGWMVQLCASKTLGSFVKRREYLNIQDDSMDRSLEALQIFLSSGPKNRKDIATYLESVGIVLPSGGIYNTLCNAGTLGLTVQGPLLDGDHLFVLTSQWIPDSKVFSEEEALKELCLRYFKSHGPATIEDLQRRSGIGNTKIKQGIEMCGNELYHEELEGKMYYFNLNSSKDSHSELNFVKNKKSNKNDTSVRFLAGYDERLLGYKDRTATLALEHHTGVDVSRNGVFKPTVMIDGRTIGTRTIKQKSKMTEIIVKPFEKLTNQELGLISLPIDYQNYLAKNVIVSIV